MKQKIAVLVLSILIFAACSTQVLILTQSDADRGAAKFTGTTFESLTHGKEVFEANCDMCHRLKKPGSKTEEEWNKIVPKMVKKVNGKVGSEQINPQKQELLRRYLVTMSAPADK